jgi:U3 small nucleolar RNA-associated protein 11
LKVLKAKAKDRNPDEFHFGMMSTQSVKGVKRGDRGNTALSMDVVKLLKTQDAAYLRTVLQKTRIERQKLEASLELDRDLKNGVVKVLGKGRQRGQRTVFVDSVGEQQAFGEENSRKNEMGRADSEHEEDEDTDSGAHQSEEDNQDPEMEDEAQKLRRIERERRLKLLEAIKRREQELVVADNELELQRAKMTNSIGGTNKNGVKYKIRERKR